MNINDIDTILVEIHGADNSIQENAATCINDDSIIIMKKAMNIQHQLLN